MSAPTGMHRGARIEDAVKGRIAVVLRRFGWLPLAVPYTGYGSAPTEREGWVRVLMRVKLSSPNTSAEESEGSGGRWWRKFFTVGLAGIPVVVRVGNRVHEVSSGRGGYVDVVLESDLPAGWHEVPVELEGRTPTAEQVRVVGPDEQFGLISDIDDTVMVTALPRPLLAFWNTFVVKETSRRPVPGMAQLYERVREQEPDGLVVYLSTGAWNVARAISRFLDRHSYPRGPLLMTDWGPTAEGWFRSGTKHKHRELRRLVSEFPQLRWVLAGDDGQHDPQLYEELADEVPDALRMVLIRQLTTVEQVLTHGSPLPPENQALRAPSPVPWLRGLDGIALAAQLDPVPPAST
ncbi:App1 family protein [Kineosporia succinea]|uniref:Phosphatidate phosphatase APP1 n=1 Tax=Kineosporia succinea TaxID=84632 RepID=A0ABT9P1C0_9ACTN|nr:phosphatase domain-containing protein [Kineosporia succinea]MDP9826458.1 phosphatidate phosphatase APP1 [Kineosporia succinea]